MDTATIHAAATAQELTDALAKILNMDAPDRWDLIWTGIVGYLPTLLTAALVLLVGLALVRYAIKLTRRFLERSKLDPTLYKFMLSILSVTLYILLGVIVLTVLVPGAIASLVALVGIFGLAVSLAVKDSLANLAGGLSVLFTKPFALGDYVKIGGTEGSIAEIRLNYTMLKTFDNKVIHIPNGDVAKAQIVNFTCEPTRRLDLTFSIGYGDNFEQAQAILLDIIARHPMALADPAPVVRMLEHGESAIKIVCRVWCATADYWPLNFDLLEEVKRRFDAAGISIPYQQLEVKLLGGAGEEIF